MVLYSFWLVLLGLVYCVILGLIYSVIGVNHPSHGEGSAVVCNSPVSVSRQEGLTSSLRASRPQC